MLKLNALGKLSLIDGEGRDFAPHGSKARGLIVLLATAPGHSRTRGWLQQRLWSDRGPEQAAGSLRAALSEIRRTLGAHRALLMTSRHAVTLDPSAFELVCEAPADTGLGGSVEAFEGVDVRDRAFETLIRDLRGRALAQWAQRRKAGPKAKRMVMVRSDARGSPAADVGARLLQNRILGALRQIDDIEIMDAGGAGDAQGEASPDGSPQSILLIRLLSVALSDGVFLSCEIHNGRKLWSDNASVPATMAAMHDSASLDKLALSAVEHVMGAFAEHAAIEGSGACAFVLERQAKDLFFRLDKASLINADRLFRRAFEIEPRGRYLVWRGFLRNAALFQHRSMSFLDDAPSVTELAVEALRLAPDDAIVQTISSQIEYVHQGNLRTPLRMAQQGVERDPTDPLGWALLSNALTTNARFEEGYRTAGHALTLARHGPYAFYFEHFACMAAVALSEYEQALVHAEAALRVRPDFVSTRRYEVALNLLGGDTPNLARSVSALRRQEPEFTPAALLDPVYPVNTLRRLPLMETIAKRAVASVGGS